jgi:hypothetical protein
LSLGKQEYHGSDYDLQYYYVVVKDTK